MTYRQGNRQKSTTNASCNMVPGLSMGRLTTNAVVETKPEAMVAYSTAVQSYALEAVVKDTTIDYNAWRHNALAAQIHTTGNALALLRAKRQWATMTLLTMTCHAM